MTAPNLFPARRLGALLALATAAVAALATAAAAPPAEAAKRASATAIHGICDGRDLCVVDPAKRSVVRLARGTAANPYSGVSATPNGRATALARGGRVFRAGPRAAAPRQVGGGITPLISPDGRGVTWRAEIQVQQCDPFGGCAQLQTFALFRRWAGEPRPTIVETYSYSSAWWGARIVSQNTRRGAAGDEISLLDGEGDPVRSLTDDPARSFTSPALSPDGRLLAVISEPLPSGDAELTYRGRVELFDTASGRRVRTLTESGEDDVPIFSPDGRQVAFNRGRDLYVVAAGGGGQARRIARGFLLTGPSWARVR